MSDVAAKPRRTKTVERHGLGILIAPTRTRRNKSREIHLGLGIVLRLCSTPTPVRRHAAIAAGIAALLASVAPAAAYEPGWGMWWQRRPAGPIAESPNTKAINRNARRAAKQKELAKDRKSVV